MFGLQLRGELPGKVEQEFENFMSRLRKLFLKEHEDDGTHQGVTYEGPVTNIRIVNGIVIEVS